MPAKRKAPSETSTATIGFEAVAKSEVRSARVEVKKSRPFVIQNSAFGICPADIGKEHADTFRHVQHPDLRADYVLANP